MTIHVSARATDMRALVGAASLGSLVGLAIGGAYLAGGLAWTSVVHARISRLADTAHAGFSESALVDTAKDAPGALAIARRFDSDANSDLDGRDRKLEAWTAQLEQRRGGGAESPQGAGGARLQLASATIEAARPFRLRGALDESRDLQCLAEAVYYEARGETPAGQAAVAQVVLNRVRHRAFPKTICGVVYQRAAAGGCQFSFACDGALHRPMDDVSWRRSQTVAARALDGRVMAAVGNATHYHVIGLTTEWDGQLEQVAQIGSHIFYRFNGHTGSRAMFNGVVSPSAVEMTPDTTKPAMASLAPVGVSGPSGASAAGLFLATTAQVVEHAAQAVENVAKPQPKAEVPRIEEAKSSGI